MNNDCVFPAIASAAKILIADAGGITEGARLLCAEKLVAFPTETVYGLGADATSDAAVARIYAAKRRPNFNPLIAHVASFKDAEAQGMFSAAARRLAVRFWPGPLTLVLPAAATATVCVTARARRSTIALRIPAHPAALSLVAAAGRPIAAPSANRSGRVSPVTAAHVFEDDAIDLLAEKLPGLSLTSLTGAEIDLSQRLKRPVGIVLKSELRGREEQEVLAQTQPL